MALILFYIFVTILIQITPILTTPYTLTDEEMALSGGYKPEDIPEKIYESLMQELPHLRDYLQQLRHRPNRSDNSLLYKSMNFTGYSSESSDLHHFSLLQPTDGSTPDARRGYGPLYEWQWRNKVGTCFYCGLDQKFIPNSTLCDDAFANEDFETVTMRRFLRAECIQMSYYDALANEFDMRKKPLDAQVEKIRNTISAAFYYFFSYTNWYMGSKTQVKSYYWIENACMKRFLDVGNIYTQRGCRRYWPIPKVPSFATHRYVRMEAALHNITDGCITSPAASLTPFARSISLWARYHVCVCQGKYCNKATKLTDNALVLYIVLLTGAHYSAISYIIS